MSKMFKDDQIEKDRKGREAWEKELSAQLSRDPERQQAIFDRLRPGDKKHLFSDGHRRNGL